MSRIHKYSQIRLSRLKSLFYSTYDGFFYSCMLGFGETYFSAFALFLGANPVQLGILTSLPPFLAGLTQFATVNLISIFKSRKRLVCFGVLAQAFSFLPIFFVYYLPKLRIEFLIFFVIFYYAFGAVIAPAWNSWIGDLVKVSQRGVYFGQRGKIMTIGVFGTMCAGGLILRGFKDNGFELWGFGLILCLALFSRITSFVFLSLKYEPAVASNVTKSLHFMEFARNLHKKNEGVLVLYMSMINFAVFLSAAYFAPFMLREHKMDYWTYTLIISGAALTKFLTFSVWGELVSKLGARRVLVVCGILICFTTVPWVFTHSPFYLFLSQCYTGVIWAGYELSNFNLLLDATEPSERTQVSSYLNIFVATASLVGGLCGVLLFTFSSGYLNPYFVVFLVSAVVRAFALVTLGVRLKEVRTIAPVNVSDVIINATGFRNALGLTTKLVVLAKRRKLLGP